MTARLSYKLINDVFRGRVYGPHDIFTARSFSDFVRRNDVDAGRALFAYECDRAIGTICFAQRAGRAWLSLMGVLPAYRRRGIGRKLFGDAVDSVIASGARTMEFEVQQRNVAAQAMYRSFGFETVGELYIWARKATKREPATLPEKRRSLGSVTRIAHNPAPCWQREAVAVARATTSALVEVDGAYAFLRLRDGNAYVLDAGATDSGRARALVEELERCVPHDITLFNEPADSPLTPALESAGWRVASKQFRMMRNA